uniref:Uncharacterized protein n=1 Tax=Glossina austeni TaxID=7395 RepID=A0A1A9UGH1_GLOAU
MHHNLSGAKHWRWLLNGLCRLAGEFSFSSSAVSVADESYSSDVFCFLGACPRGGNKRSSDFVIATLDALLPAGVVIVSGREGVALTKLTTGVTETICDGFCTLNELLSFDKISLENKIAK